MKLGILLVGLCLIPVSAGAIDCLYFRTDYKFRHCAAAKADEQKMPDYATPDLDTPEVPKDPEKPFAKVICECDYSLSGSNPLCDFDKADETSYIIPVDNVSDACRRGRDLCDDLCPRQEH